MRPIDADALLKDAVEYPSYDGFIEVVTVDRIENASTLNVATVAHARWEHGRGEWDNILGEYYLRPTYICSNCRKEDMQNTPYCPHCGATMKQRLIDANALKKMRVKLRFSINTVANALLMR